MIEFFGRQNLRVVAYRDRRISACCLLLDIEYSWSILARMIKSNPGVRICLKVQLDRGNLKGDIRIVVHNRCRNASGKAEEYD